jgi:hypothetical protein
MKRIRIDDATGITTRVYIGIRIGRRWKRKEGDSASRHHQHDAAGKLLQAQLQ